MSTPGKITIHTDDGDPNDNKKDLVQSQPSSRTQQSQQQQQQQGQQLSNISDDEGDMSSHEVKVSFSGLDAAKVCHFFKNKLEHLAEYYHAKVTRDPPEGSLTNVTIKGDEKYAKDLGDMVKKIQEDLKGLSEEVVKLDVTKVEKVKDIVKQYPAESGVLVYINPMTRNVHVVAGDYEKLSQALHQVKVALGLISVSTKAGRQMVTSSQSGGRNNLYPSLPSGSGNDKAMPGGDRSEEDMETEDYEDRNQRVSNTRDGDQRSGEQNNRDRGGGGAYGRNTDRGDQYGRSDGEDFKFTFSFSSGFVLKVYKASITKLDVDVIVNAANDNLMHGGGVAAVISKAAGWRLDEASSRYVMERGILRVAENCLTTAGNLHYKRVIHAVGPQWGDYIGVEKKEQCLHDLKKTVYNILLKAEEQEYEKVAMSAISAGIYAVPKELCADMYVQAAAEFAEKKKRYPMELHIVDIDVSILKLVMESCKKMENDPESIKPSAALKQYIKDNPNSVRWTNQSQSYGRGRRAHRHFSDSGGATPNTSHLSNEFEGLSLKEDGKRPLAWGGEETIFNVNESLKVHVYMGKIDKVSNVDALVCSVDTSFNTNGYIVKAFLKTLGKKYEKNFDKMKKDKSPAEVTYVYTCESGSFGRPHVMHLAMTPILHGREDEFKEYRKGIFNVFAKADDRKFGKIALPMLGTGYIVSNQKSLKSCGKCLLEALRDFCCQVKGKHLMEIHLVNHTENVTKMLRDLFEEVGKATNSGTYKKPTVESVQNVGTHEPGENRGFNKSWHEIRNSGLQSSRQTENAVSDGFDDFTLSRIKDGKDRDRSDFNETATPSASGVPVQPEGSKKKTGNLKIYHD